jgi:hypothetical protein
MKKTLILVAIIISTSCLSQTINDTIPYLKSEIINNISLYKDKPLSILLDKIPYPIKGYSLIAGNTNPVKDTKVAAITLFVSGKRSDSLFDENLNYSPKTITIYLKYENILFLNPAFRNSRDRNNWTSFIENEFRNSRYIVGNIVINCN